MRKTALIGVAAMLLIPATVRAGNQPHPTLDAIATQVAGKPVSVWCENSAPEWESLTATANVPHWADGFTYVAQPAVYVAPRLCETLHVALRNGAAAVGAYWLSGALLTLAHESVHQRGIVDEQLADCTALPLVGPLATQFFNVPATVSQQRILKSTRIVTRKVRGVKVRIKVQDTKLVYVSVPNPFLAQVVSWSVAWHNSYGPPC
jgi:hypothetical protein